MADSLRLDELRRRVQRDPASIAFAALAEELRRDGQYDAAIAACEAGLQRHPAYVSARVTLGRALFESGQYARAQAELEEVLRVAPENLAAIRGLAEIHRRLDEIDDDGAAPASTGVVHPPDQATAVAAPTPGPFMPPSDVQLSAAATEPVHMQAAEPAAGAGPARNGFDLETIPPAGAAHTPAREPVRPMCQPHPDAAALPALEAFLSAIRSGRPGPSGVEPPAC